MIGEVLEKERERERQSERENHKDQHTVAVARNKTQLLIDGFLQRTVLLDLVVLP